jgi:S-sulfosulfanyl-L-cysteine sulfohydrolase
MKNKAKLTILQINDTHGYLDPHWEWMAGPHEPGYRAAGGFARIGTLARQIREETQGRVLFCDNGDTFHGTHPIVQSRGEILVPILNQLGLNAMTVHWDFAYGPEHLKSLASRLNYPVLATNIYHTQTGQRFFPPYAVQEVGGLKIGIIGIASNITAKTMPPHFSEGLRFTDGREELPEFIKEVRAKQGADLVVVLSHLGFPQDMKLLSEVSGVDVLLSGHTHHRLFYPVRQGKTLVIQSGCHGAFVGRLDLEVLEGQVVEYRHQLIEVAEENLERTFSADPFHQMGGYVKRCLGLTAYIKIENPPGTRIQKLFIGDEEVHPDQTYRAAYLTMQGVPEKFGRKRQDLPQHAYEAMLAYLDKHKPASAELGGIVVAN